MLPLHIERNIEKITESGCWIWSASIRKDGYVKISIKGKTVLAHRAIYELSIGEIPQGMQLDHLCRVRS